MAFHIYNGGILVEMGHGDVLIGFATLNDRDYESVVTFQPASEPAPIGNLVADIVKTSEPEYGEVPVILTFERRESLDALILGLQEMRAQMPPDSDRQEVGTICPS